MKIVSVRAIPMSDPVPRKRQHRTDLGTKVKSDAKLILVETDNGFAGMGFTLRPDALERFKYVEGLEYAF